MPFLLLLEAALTSSSSRVWLSKLRRTFYSKIVQLRLLFILSRTQNSNKWLDFNKGRTLAASYHLCPCGTTCFPLSLSFSLFCPLKPRRYFSFSLQSIFDRYGIIHLAFLFIEHINARSTRYVCCNKYDENFFLRFFQQSTTSNKVTKR